MATEEDRILFLRELHKGLQQRFNDLSDNDRDIMRLNKGTAYERVLRHILGADILGGLTTRSENKAVRKRGLAAR
tara:strand:+ start:714 stop:938 length:225 start_codon:yes stop_codon:yes gene_type:complete